MTSGDPPLIAPECAIPASRLGPEECRGGLKIRPCVPNELVARMSASGERCPGLQANLASRLLQMLRQEFQRGDCRLEIRGFAVNHVPPKCDVIVCKGVVGSDPVDCLERFSKRIGLIRGEIFAIGLCVINHDLPCKGSDLA